MRRDTAEEVAAGALAWLVEAGLWEPFAAETGADAEALRGALAEPAGRGEALGAVLDFVMTRDEWALGAAAAAGVPPEALARARAALPGGDAAHWT